MIDPITRDYITRELDLKLEVLIMRAVQKIVEEKFKDDIKNAVRAEMIQMITNMKLLIDK